ncbi:hypothetical protein K501DRAFT_331781 [Backusella circina FSU 941]|nr:hypothetical protein K501DRAFT_331781 [Backusella circina FSU 941]
METKDGSCSNTEKNKQWESLFDPQHTFGSFQTTSGTCYDDFYNNFDWSLSRKDLVLDEKNKSLFSSLPTLPRVEDLESHINSVAFESPAENKSTTGQVEILPRPSRPFFSTPNQPKRDEKKLKEKLELLQLIRQCGFNNDMDGSKYNPSEVSAAHRIHRNLFTTTEKIKRETKQELSVGNKTYDNTSLSSIGDVYDHNVDLELQVDAKTKKPEQFHETNLRRRPRNRISFLFFVFGFMLPPLWIIGALYVPRYSLHRTAASIEIDKKWKKYCRNAFLIFLVSVISAAILLFIIKPSFIGYRSSHKENHTSEDPIIFDDGK